ncbi:MAG: peptidylprolyl isomerase [Marinifilaceae bacterium]
MKNYIYLLLFVLLITSCKSNNKPASKTDQTNRIIQVSTEFGDMKIRLYDETPVHRDNFVKLTKAEFFNGTLFHRVINGFMIQGGDPDSKTAEPGARLGEGGPGYQLPAEFKKELFHKRGVIAAAREGDNVNPQKKSAGSQFYIAQGKVYRSGELDSLVVKINNRRRAAIFDRLRNKYSTQLMKWQEEGEMLKIADFQGKMPQMVDSLMNDEKLILTEAQRKAYTTIGGIPHLDGNYTVFGEVIEGLEIIDKIAAVEKDPFDRPLKDIEMTIKVLQ